MFVPRLSNQVVRTIRCHRMFSSHTLQQQRSSDSTLAQYGQHLQLFHDVISEDEEIEVVRFLDPILARKKYEGHHWDDVIAKYKEIELISSYKVPEIVVSIFSRIESHIELSLNRQKIEFLKPHVIDLAKEGHIAPHVDSIKFSGDLIAGLSLFSQRIMELTLDSSTLPPDEKSSEGCDVNDSGLKQSLSTGQEDSLKQQLTAYPEKISFAVPARSLYILTGPMRYNYAHAVLGQAQQAKNGVDLKESFSREGGNKELSKAELCNAVIERRLSVIFRNIKEEV